MKCDGGSKDDGAGDVGYRTGDHQQQTACNSQRALRDVHVRHQVAAQSCGNGGHAQNSRDGNDGDAAKRGVNEQHVGAEGEDEGNDEGGNIFNFSDEFTIADLPGYGYAKVSKEAQAKWQKYLEEYLLNRTQIKSLIQFIDARHDVQKNDLQMRKWVEAYNLPIFTIVTKIDYIPRSKVQKVVSDVKKQLGGDVLPFSSADRFYCEKTIEYLLNLCE